MQSVPDAHFEVADGTEAERLRRLVDDGDLTRLVAAQRAAQAANHWRKHVHHAFSLFQLQNPSMVVKYIYYSLRFRQIMNIAWDNNKRTQTGNCYASIMPLENSFNGEGNEPHFIININNFV